ncbi:MAG TPA: hypothetical protein DDX07_12730 [Porphyromonadaceae bacterium]|jgi:hypothetical protein|nr:hypothetical protein [Porphyromonadaceae bacterium]
MESQVSFTLVVSRRCGTDVHKKRLVATISGEGFKAETCEFGTVTRSLTELKEWLLDNRITHVVMESTGVHWNPVYHVPAPYENALERLREIPGWNRKSVKNHRAGHGCFAL